MTNPIKRVSQPFPSMILSSIFVFGKGYNVFVCCVLEWRAHFQLKTKRLKQKDLSVAPFAWQTFELESWLSPVWGRYLFFLGNSQVWVFENKKCKELSGPVLLFLGNLKSCLGPPGLRKPKRGDYEVMVGVMVCVINWGIRLSCLKRFFY